MDYDLRSLTIPELLSRGLGLYLNNFLPLFLIAILANMPMMLFSSLLNKIEALEMGEYLQFLLPFLVVWIIQLMTSVTAASLSILVIARRYLGRKADLNYLLPQALKLVLPVMGLGLLNGLAVALGFVFLIVPGFILFSGLSMAQSILVVEKTGIIESMKRSWRLTSGYKFQVFGIMFLTMMIGSICGGFLDMLSTPLLGGADENSFIALFLPVLTSALVGPFVSSVSVLLYFNLKVEKEGFVLEGLAAQFPEAPGDFRE